MIIGTGKGASPVKFLIVEGDIDMMEKALNLKFTSSFEDNFLNNLKARFKEYGLKMVITTDQRKILIQLSDRYDVV